MAVGQRRVKSNVILEEVTERLIVADCKSVGKSYVGSNPTFFKKKIVPFV